MNSNANGDGMSNGDDYGATATRERLRLAGVPFIIWGYSEAPEPPMHLPITGGNAPSYRKSYAGDDAEITEYRERLRVFLDERTERFRAERDEEDLDAEVRTQRIREQARDTVRRERAEADFTPPPYHPSLVEELAEHIEPPEPRIESLSFVEQNVLCAARAKAGKTTLSVNLTRSLADGEPFLGSLPVKPPAGNVGYLNYEMSRAQFNAWLRDADIRHPERVSVLHLRGFRLPLTAPVVQDYIVNWATECEVQALIADPWGRMMVGSGSENSNDDVRAVLEIVGDVKRRAGITDLFVIAHMGHTQFEQGQERARGASELLGWPDVLWNLTEQDGTRFLSAVGRDVDFSEQSLSYDATTRRLAVLGVPGSTGGNRTQHRRQRGAEAVRDVVRESPGITSSDLHDELASRGWSNHGQRDEARKAALRDRLVHSKRDGRNNRYWPGPAPGDPQIVEGELVKWASEL